MKLRHSFLLSLVLLGSLAPAKDDIPLLRPEEREAVDAQADRFNKALEPALAEAAKSTVRVWSGKFRLAYGTVIGEGDKVLTKWSEIARFRDRTLLVQTGDNQSRRATITEVHEKDDLAILTLDGGKLTPVRWAARELPLGTFLIAAQPTGKSAAFGVVSVLERNLRDTDQAFIGVAGALGFDGPGVKVEHVTEGSGAAKAGLKKGEIILQIGERPLSGMMELRNAVSAAAPGDSIQLTVKNAKGGQRVIDVVLGNRPELPTFPGDRLRAMERMGGRLSQVRDSFTRVVQTDMRPDPDQVGGPVVDLDGNVVGITVARTDRTRSFLMPASVVQEILQEEGKSPELASVETEKPASQRVRIVGGADEQPAPRQTEQRLRRHLESMQELMEFMQEEMDALERGR
jgi:S1-C subfamily serine protease